MDKERIPTSKIIDLMTGDAGFSRNVAEEFVYALFATIEEALLLGENVKIKGFGTFKLQWNQARESIDQYTGNEIIIPGFYVVEFVPESELSEQLNEPFAHLEAFLLPKEEVMTVEPVVSVENDDIFEEINSTSGNVNSFAAQVDEIKDILSEIQALSNPKNTENTEKLKKINNMSKENIVNQSFDKEESDSSETTPLQDGFDVVRDVSLIYGERKQEIQQELKIEEISEVEESTAVEKEEILLINEVVEDVPETTNIEEKAGNKIEEKIEIETETVDEPQETIRTKSEKVHRKKRKSPALIISLILLAAIGGAAIWFLPPYLSQKKKEVQNRLRLEYLADSVANEKQITRIKDSLEAQRLREAQALLTDSITDGQDSTIVVKEEQKTTPTPNEESKQSVQKEASTAKDNAFTTQRVYKEFLATEKMTVGSQLTSFARKYYGSPHFWVYIYEANKSKIKDPNRVPAGIDVKIPKMDPRLVNPNDKEALEYAKKLQSKYLGQ